MEPYPLHYSLCPRQESADVTLKTMFEDLQQMVTRLGEKIEERCGGLEGRVAQSEQRAEERFVSLEMAHSEVEQGQVELGKQFDGLKLEVNCLNRFLERENMSNPQDKAGIFGVGDTDTSSSAAGAMRGQRDPDPLPHAHSMHTSDHFRGEHSRLHQQNHHGEGDRTSYGHLPKLQFPVFSGEDP
jgi:hypothetical protein